jgi:hypothetical protein
LFATTLFNRIPQTHTANNTPSKGEATIIIGAGISASALPSTSQEHATLASLSSTDSHTTVDSENKPEQPSMDAKMARGACYGKTAKLRFR